MRRAAAWLGGSLVALWLAAACFAWVRYVDEQDRIDSQVVAGEATGEE